MFRMTNSAPSGAALKAWSCTRESAHRTTVARECCPSRSGVNQAGGCRATKRALSWSSVPRIAAAGRATGGPSAQTGTAMSSEVTKRNKRAIGPTVRTPPALAVWVAVRDPAG